MTAVLIKSLCILLITAGLSLYLGAQRSEYAFLISLACGAVVLIIVLEPVMPYVARLKAAFGKASGAASYFALPVKALGIAYITDFVADTCRDSGLGALASKAEFAGKCAIFVLCVPAAINVLEVALRFAGL